VQISLAQRLRLDKYSYWISSEQTAAAAAVLLLRVDFSCRM